MIRPLGELLQNVGISIVDTQREMDDAAIATQERIDKDVAEGRLLYRLEAPWYHYAQIDLELKLAISMLERTTSSGKSNPAGTPTRRVVALAAPMNATYNNLFEYDMSGASQIKARIMSVPPPTQVKEE